MKYSKEIEIDLPLAKAVELFDNEENLKKWQAGLVAYEHQSGKRGAPGAKTKITYRMGKRTLEMIETIVTRDPPHHFVFNYESGGVWNQVRNHFTATDRARTKLRVETEFKCKGMMKLMTILMPGAFKRQTAAFMRDFKDFAEREGRTA